MFSSFIAPSSLPHGKIAAWQSSSIETTPSECARTLASFEAAFMQSEIDMPARKKSANEPLISVAIEQRARSACSDLKPLTDPMTPEELQERAEMIDRVIRARQKLQLLRNRTDALKTALQRFKTQRDAMRA